MPSYFTPGVYFETVDVGRKAIAAIRTDVAAFVGLCERGPLDKPTRVGSWEQFQSVFGNFIRSGYLAYSAKAFFENGGKTCYVVRVAATDALAASVILMDENDTPTLQVMAHGPGIWGNGLAVRIAHSNSAATRTSSAKQPTDRTASLVESVVGFSSGSQVLIFQEQSPAPHRSVRVVGKVDPVYNRLIWNEALDASFDLSAPLYFESLEFALTVCIGGQSHEHFSGLSFVKWDELRYAESAINKVSRLIRVKDLDSPSDLPARLPRFAPGGSIRLQGGSDGLAALRVKDFTGDEADEIKRGLRALEDVDEVSIVAVPDILTRPVPQVEIASEPEPERDPCLLEPPPADPAIPLPADLMEQVPLFSVEQVFAVQQALVAHCEAQRDRIALLDPPLSSASDVADLAEIQSWRQRFDSSYAALYFPWVLVYDPLRIGNQVVRAIPPSGHVAGIFSRTDLEAGVHKAPANEELIWSQGASLEVSAEMQGLLNPSGINVIRTFAGRGLRLYGARTATSDAEWRYINVRRLLMMIEEAVEDSVQWSVFEPGNFYLRQSMILAISSFLYRLWQRGALAGATPDEAFFVKCDEENNPPEVTDLGRLIVDVGVAPVIPAEFIVFRIGKTEEELELTE